MSVHVPRVFLHIGTPKSGTTYLQTRLDANREELAAQGVFWPGPWRRVIEAVRELRSLPEGAELEADGPWNRLAAEALAWPAETALISMEWMASCAPHQVRAAVASLAPARVEVVCTARDLARNFVAQAQEMAKQYRTWTWERIVEEVCGEVEGQISTVFWRQQDLGGILDRWSGGVPADRIHLVTLPPAGADPEVLWERFCTVLGIDGERFAPPELTNESLGVVSTVLMQRLNVAASERRLPHPVYNRIVHTGVGMRILSDRRDQEDRIGLDEPTQRYLQERGRSTVADLARRGLSLVGEWEDLVPRELPAGRLPQEVTDAELLELCLEVVLDQGLREDRARPEAGSGTAPGGGSPSSAATPRPGRWGRRRRGSSD